MLNSAFNGLTGDTADFYPQALRSEIDDINKRIYETVNNGVYRCGFATTQEAYEEAFAQLFETLDVLEGRLSTQRYLCGKAVTEADWRLFPTLIRFDAVYVGHFKCNLRRIDDYPNLSNYMRELYQWPGVADTVNVDQYKRHYYGSHQEHQSDRHRAGGPRARIHASRTIADASADQAGTRHAAAQLGIKKSSRNIRARADFPSCHP